MVLTNSFSNESNTVKHVFGSLVAFILLKDIGLILHKKFKKIFKYFIKCYKIKYLNLFKYNYEK